MLPPATLQLAADFGRRCGERGIRLVYGGGTRGLMGIAAGATTVDQANAAFAWSTVVAPAA